MGHGPQRSEGADESRAEKKGEGGKTPLVGAERKEHGVSRATSKNLLKC